MMDKRILIIGAGGQARIALDVLSYSEGQVIGFLDSNESLKGTKKYNINVLGKPEDILSFKDMFDECHIAIGDVVARHKMVELIKEKMPKIKFSTIKHPSAVISKSVKIGDGTIICAGVIIAADALVGSHNLINDGAIVEHGCILGDFVNISPGAKLASTITVGDMAFIGLGACLIEDIKIGKNSVIGAGSVVLKNVPENVLAVGIPAEVKRENG